MPWLGTSSIFRSFENQSYMIWHDHSNHSMPWMWIPLDFHNPMIHLAGTILWPTTYINWPWNIQAWQFWQSFGMFGGVADQYRIYRPTGVSWHRLQAMGHFMSVAPGHAWPPEFSTWSPDLHGLRSAVQNPVVSHFSSGGPGPDRPDRPDRSAVDPHQAVKDMKASKTIQDLDRWWYMIFRNRTCWNFHNSFAPVLMMASWRLVAWSCLRPRLRRWGMETPATEEHVAVGAGMNLLRAVWC